ncbi:putative bifunctional diguanylate cyclase/phosphodiesterase [Rhizomonospora bruguierae]|uniref:putative bifunctional diguanylate cyclase/phosphodiesterase n=1 Tax=Rhizomonospora bruguierae TaxID=1581705 RepID=UPI0020BD97C6|nr:bifunctional diguanylate cyclase/phosphodiesterase [Micromonospora sp. NBRC 107566]
MTRPTTNDNATDRRLRLLVGLVVVAAFVAVALAILLIALAPEPPGGLNAVILVCLIAISARTVVDVRIRSAKYGMAWTGVAVFVGLAIAPAPWIVVFTALGVAVAKAVMRLPPIKQAFGVAKGVLSTAGAALVLGAFGPTTLIEDPVGHLAPLVAAYIVYTIIDELFLIPVLALDTRTRMRERLLANLDIRFFGMAMHFAVVLVALVLLHQNRNLLFAVPPLVLSLHLAYSNRMRTRTERWAWQNLAAATDGLNVVELDRVLATAIHGACGLFSADEVEVEIRREDAPRRLVRGTLDAIGYDGDPDRAPAEPVQTYPVPLESHEGTVLGELRLRFRGAVKLSEREQYTLRTFASALCTALRNASAYAELERIAVENAHAAAHDPLTGLANRRQLLERATALLVKGPTEGVTALLLIDLNHFKEVNDTLGHAAGDRVLIAVAERLRAAARPGDVVARLGGDEFAVLLTGLPAPAVATPRAEALLGALYEPIDLDGMRITVEASGGIAVANGTGGVGELLRRADVAMYQAKRSGQRTATYARTRDTADLGRLSLGGDLPRAVKEHEFTVKFQPIVDLGTGEVIAAEALARWHHPKRGNLDPRRFLDAVERSGLLPAFAEAVLDQALIAAGTWREADFDIPVAVNVSPRSLLDARFPGAVLARLRAHDLPPDRLFLELTETLTISHLEVVDDVLRQLRDGGVRLALDDFGTGYSSLSVLSRIPVHELKVDRAFVSAMESSTEAAAVVRSTVDLARSLNLVVVAEGVESESQRHALWELGCTAGQGHLFSRPMTADRLLAALHRGSGGRPGTLAPPLHQEGSVIRLSPARRACDRARGEHLPQFPA